MNTSPPAHDFAKIRLFVETDLRVGEQFTLADGQVHYLLNVMRQKEGDRVVLFNGRDGEWVVELCELKKKRGQARPLEQTRAQTPSPDLELLFAPVKKLRLDFLVQKATEMGVSKVTPVQTQYTNAKVKETRIEANVIEAAEQSGRLDVPVVGETVKLADVLKDWPEGRRLLFCDEAEDATPIKPALAAETSGQPWSILIGPEGGFAPQERTDLRAHKGALAVSLGPRIMRADTAALAALAVFQAELGDW